MRHAAKVDGNQADIVRQLRQIGVSVQLLSAVGCGCPDLLLGYHRRNVLIELKDGTKPPSGRQLTGDQTLWHGTWNGQVAVCKNLDEVLAALNKAVRK